MKNLYITKSGDLKRKDNTLIFKNEVIKKVIPIEGIETIYAVGQINTNSKLLTYLQQNKITIHFFNYYGYYTGSFYPREAYVSGNLFIKQVEHYQDNNKRIIIAQKIVEGIAQNLKNTLRHYSKHGAEINKIYDLINTSCKNLKHTKNIKKILLYEGQIWDNFYQTLKVILNDFEFNKRVKRPPDNPINTMISFGNSLLYTRVLSQIYYTQLNPTISYLHEPFERRFSLALDIAEVFKPNIVFKTILKLVNKRMISREHFDKTVEFCHLNEEGRKIFLLEFDKRLTKTKKHPNLKRKVSSQHLIKLEAYKLIKHLFEEKEYLPFNLKKWA